MPEWQDAVATIVDHGSTAAATESPTLDFKTVGRSVSDFLKGLADEAACFANAHGGVIVVGVSDKVPGSDALIGSTLDPIQVGTRIYELTEPSLNVLVTSERVHGAELTVITVPSSPDVHQVGGKASERIGTGCQPMSAARISAVLADRRGDDWSAKDSGEPAGHATATAQETTRELLAQVSDPERNSWAQLPWPDVCRRLGVLTGQHLTNGGALLFVDSGSTAHAQYIRRAPNSGLLSTNEIVRGPGIVAIRRLLELIESRLERTAIITPTGQQLLIGDLPDVAVREAVINAVMHRDYRNPAPIHVEHAASRLRITSPGGFVPGVTVDNVLTVSSRSRNMSLSHAIRSLGLAESAGVGVDRMYASMTSIGHQPPHFSTDGVTVEASLHGGSPNEPLARFVAGLPDDRRGDPDTLLTLTYLLDHRTTKAAIMAPLMQKPEVEAEDKLLELSAPGNAMIERTADSARSKRGVYRLVGEVITALGPAVRYRARSGDDTDRKIITIVREADTITGRMVQTMFDVEPATASRILSDLVDREILVKTSKATRGPSVTYGPGQRFPRAKKRSSSRKPPEPQSPLDFDGED